MSYDLDMDLDLAYGRASVSTRLHILGHRLIKGSTFSEHLKQGTSTRGLSRARDSPIALQLEELKPSVSTPSVSVFVCVCVCIVCVQRRLLCSQEPAKSALGGLSDME